MKRFLKKSVVFVVTICIFSLSLTFSLNYLSKNVENIADAGLVQTTLSSGKIYQIRNKLTGKYLDVSAGATSNGTNIQQWPQNFLNPQRFQLIRVTSEIFQIIPIIAENMRVDVSGGSTANGANIQIYSANGTDSQQFKITSTGLGDGSFKILTKITNYEKCISADTDTSIANIFQWSCLNQNRNFWYFEEAFGEEQATLSTNKVYFIRNQKSNLYMDMKNGGTTSETKIQQYTFNGTVSQMFMLQPTGESNVYYIKPLANTDLNMDVEGGSASDGAQIQAYYANGTNAQKFKIIAANAGTNNFKILTKLTNYSKGLGIANPSDSIIYQYPYVSNTRESQWFFEEAFTNYSRVNTVGANQTTSVKFTFPDDKYYNIELSGDNVNTFLSLSGYQSGAIGVNNGGVGETDKICIKGIQGRTITANISILNGQSAQTTFRIYKMRAVMYGFHYNAIQNKPVLDTTFYIDSPNANINEECISIKYKNKSVSSILTEDERNIKRLNSDIVFITGHANYSRMFCENYQSELLADYIMNLNRVRFIFFAGCNTGSPLGGENGINAGENLVTNAVSTENGNKPAKAALGFKQEVVDTDAKEFGEWLFYYLRDYSIQDAVNITAGKFRADCEVRDVLLLGEGINDRLFPDSWMRMTLQSSTSTTLVSEFESVRSEYNDVCELSKNIYRYHKTVNGIRTDDFYDVQYDENNNVINISRSKNIISDEKIYPIMYSSMDVKVNSDLNKNMSSIKTSIEYCNIDNELVPVEFNYCTYYNGKYSYQEVYCYNLFDGSSIDYSKINIVK